MYLPPVDPSSIPSSSSVKPKTRVMLEKCESGFKLRKLNHVVEKDNAIQMESNITTQTHAQENNPVSEPEAETQRMSAKDQLYKLCGVRHWKPPVYECCHDEGPCNMRLFIVRATVEIKEDSRTTVLECFGDPQHKKKIAAEQAAEAALWYLKNVGHTLQTDKASGRRGQTKPLQKVLVTGEPHNDCQLESVNMTK